MVVGWGGTYGHLYSAVEAMNAEGKPVAFAHFNYINPLPANTDEILRRYNKIQAQPFMVSELMAHFSKLLEE